MVRWSSNCKAEKILLQLLESGSITGDEKPGVVYKMDQEFGKFTPDTFARHYRELCIDFRAKMNTHVDDASMHSVKEFAGNETSKRPRFDIDSDLVSNTLAVCDDQTDRIKNQPQAVSYAYEDPENNLKYVIAAVILHGSASKDETRFRRRLIMKNGVQYLECRQNWQSELLDGKQLFKDKPNMVSYHPMLAELKTALKKIRSHVTEIPEEIIEVKLAEPVIEEKETWSEYTETLESGSTLLRTRFKGKNTEYADDPSSDVVIVPKTENHDPKAK